MKRKLITGIGMKKKLFPISAIIALLCLTPMFVMWTSAQTPPTLSLTFTATGGNFRGKGSCLQASSGMIVADLPRGPYPFELDSFTKTIGGISWEATYSYDNTLSLPLNLEVDIMVHIHIDGPFRRLKENVPEDITMLAITGCTLAPVDGVQYCINVHSDIGTVTKKGDTWEVYADFETSNHGSPGLCVSNWIGGEVDDGFCVPLKDFKVVCTGTITK